MKFVETPLSKTEMDDLQKQYGDYVKVTVDIEKAILVVGCDLHADGEDLLLKKGSIQDDIWGGGIDLRSKLIDSTAVLNLRPRFDNNSMEILDPTRRSKFIMVVKRMFNVL